MECYYCKGEMKPGETSYSVSRDDYHLLISNLPAHICKQCGEPYFEPEEVDLIQDLIRGLEAKLRKLREIKVA